MEPDKEMEKNEESKDDKDEIKKDLSAGSDETKEAPIKKLQSILFGTRPATATSLETEFPKQENFSRQEGTFSNETPSKPKMLKPVKPSQRGDLNWQQDECLPSGWTFALVYSPQFDIPLKKLKSPGGQFFNSVVQAIQHLHGQPDKKEEFEQMKKFLIKEGWFTTEFLPKGFWLRQKRSEKGFYSLSANLEQFRTMRPLFNHLREVYGEEAEKLFEENYRSLQAGWHKVREPTNRVHR